MEIRKVNIGNNEYMFINEYWDRSNAWGHKTTLFKNSFEIMNHRCRYYNRTWEVYTYQTCMACTLDDLYDSTLNRYIRNYKYTNNIDRFKKGQKKQLIEEFNKTEIAQDIQKLKACVRDRNFN